ncbi:MAG: hypothetical protein VYE68_08885 [Acidobacteriota bacterium]|nr:hypothetical protein [Acidobacteriota bacterium]
MLVDGGYARRIAVTLDGVESGAAEAGAPVTGHPWVRLWMGAHYTCTRFREDHPKGFAGMGGRYEYEDVQLLATLVM